MERGDEKHEATDGKRNKRSRRNTSRAEEKEIGAKTKGNKTWVQS